MRDVVKYRLVIKEGIDVTLNGYQAKITYKDNIEHATLSYTFPVLTESGVADDPDRVLAGVKDTVSSGTNVTDTDQTFTEAPTLFEDRIDFTVTKPVAGQTPSVSAKTSHPDILVTGVKWDGVFTPDKKFMAGNTYTVKISFKIKGDVNKILQPNAAGKRYASINGEGTYYALSDNTFKTGTVTASYEAPMPKTYINMGWIYSKEDADRIKSSVTDKLYVYKSYKEANELKFYSEIDAVEDVTHVIVDAEGKISGAFMEELHNLQEVWLSSKVDAKYFIQSFVDAGPMYQRMYAWTSNGAKTWDFKLYVPKDSLPNGLQSGFVLRSRFFWFETVLYDGDVYEAYEKKQAGQDVKIPWCTNHKYTNRVTTADHVMIERDCYHSRWFCYSCEYCGKPEMNINHIFSVDDTNPRLF